MAEWRLGILGGTFNPIHLGHLVLAEAFRERLELDRVLFVPAGTPPHKPPIGLVPSLHRYAMVSLAVAGHPGFVACPVEVERAGPSYSAETIEALAGLTVGERDRRHTPSRFRWKSPELRNERVSVLSGHANITDEHVELRLRNAIERFRGARGTDDLGSTLR